jgi:hypothetical protein
MGTTVAMPGPSLSGRRAPGSTGNTAAILPAPPTFADRRAALKKKAFFAFGYLAA